MKIELRVQCRNPYFVAVTVTLQSGLMLDDKDPSVVWLSMGINDRDGEILKIDLRALYETMADVAECGNV